MVTGFPMAISQPENLVVFFGRSLGMLCSLLAIFAIIVVNSPEAKPFYFNLLLSVLGGMGVLHVYGAITKTQPITETIEIFLWIILFTLTLCFYPS